MASLAVLPLQDDHAWRRDVAAAVSRKFPNRRVTLPGDSPNNSLDNSIQSQHVVTSERSQHATEDDPMSLPLKRKNLAVPKKLTLHEVKADLNAAVARALPKHRITAKEIAAEIDVTETTADNLRRDVPDAMARLVMLSTAFPEFGAEVRRIMGMERDLDPEFQREFAQLLRRVL